MPHVHSIPVTNPNVLLEVTLALADKAILVSLWKVQKIITVVTEVEVWVTA